RVDSDDGTPPSVAQLMQAVEHPEDAADNYWGKWTTDYDYVYVLFTDGGDYANPDPVRLIPVYTGERFALFQINPPPASPAVEQPAEVAATNPVVDDEAQPQVAETRMPLPQTTAAETLPSHSSGSCPCPLRLVSKGCGRLAEIPIGGRARHHRRRAACASPREGASAGHARAQETRLDSRQGAGLARLPRDPRNRARERSAHRVRGGRLPQYRRVLGQEARNLHDHGGHLHACLRVL